MPHVKFIAPNGEHWPSVTEVLRVSDQPWKWRWYGSEVKKHGYRGWQKCDAMGKRGMSFGTDFHTRLYDLLNFKFFAVPIPSPMVWVSAPRFRDKVSECVQVVYDYVIDSGVKVIALEQHLVNEKDRYHGSFDAVVESPEGLIEVWDWKTNNQEDPYHAVQLSAYAAAFGIKGAVCDRGRVIQVDKKAKTPKVKAHVFTDLHFYYDLFLALRDNWDFAHSAGRWQRGDDE